MLSTPKFLSKKMASHFFEIFAAACAHGLSAQGLPGRTPASREVFFPTYMPSKKTD
jgi:hypothetical protein